MEAALTELATENTYFKAKVDNLDNCSWHQNIHIVGVPESTSPISVKFVSDLLLEVMDDSLFEKPPELDRVYRSLHPKPALGERPRVIIV